MNLQELNTELALIYSKTNAPDYFRFLGEIPIFDRVKQFGFLPPEASDRWKHQAACCSTYSHHPVDAASIL